MTAGTSVPPLDPETLADLGSADGYAVIVVREGRARLVVEGVLEVEGGAREIPWTTSSAVTVRATRPATTRAAGPDSGAYDFLWGSTVHGHVSTAAVPVQRDDDEQPAATAEVSALPTPVTVQASASASAPEASATVVPEVSPVVIAPASGTAAAIGTGTAAVTGTATTAAAPRTAQLSTGQSIRVEGTVVFGRSPGARAGLHEHPLFVAVPSPLTDISRNHLELWLEGEVLLARDLGSTNGTLLHRAGERSVRVPVDAPTLVRVGDIYDLGEGVLVSFGAEGAA